MIKIRLKDDEREYEQGILALDIAKDISEGFARNVIACKINGIPSDLNTPISKDSTVEFLKFEDEEGKEVFWHSGAHITAQAIKRLYKDAVLSTGPAVDGGFYYDIDMEHKLTEEDFPQIEKEISNIVKEKLDIKREVVSKEEAIKIMEERQEKYKIEKINSLPNDATISLYRQGEFVDLCTGPHLMNTKLLKAVKLTKIAGAYYKNDANNKMLQRLYGIAFPKKKELDEYLALIEEAKKRDHRKLGRELDLFSMNDMGPGFPFFHAKGMILRNKLLDFWRDVHHKAGYDEISTPCILNEKLWHQSGHWDHYKENMYFTKIDDENYAIKPMNCPGSILVYKAHNFSYRDFPLRWAEVGLVHRHELSGALHGLMRVRAFNQDDAHLYVLKEQVKDELIGIIELEDYIYKVFGFKYHVELSTRPENSMGSNEDWEMATEGLRKALEAKNIDYIVNEGDGAFYGPKIDFHLEDAIGRTWQCGTIQLDFQMPERFDITYIDNNGEKQRPVMIHRTVFGSIERFIGILIEHFAGRFPLWIAPEQIRILPISDKYNDYADKVKVELEKNNFRATIDKRAEKTGYKIRESQLKKIPYMVIIGEKEENENNISVRSRDLGDLGSMNLNDFIEKLKKEDYEKLIIKQGE